MLRTLVLPLAVREQCVAGAGACRTAHYSTAVDTECVVIGAGVVGLSVAKHIAEAGRDVLLLEQNSHVGMETSSRNSEVIHAGMHYTPGSLKARMCVQGKRLLYQYTAERGVNVRRMGKLIVATTDAQVETLRRIADVGAANGVDDLQWLSGEKAARLEPELSAKAALLSPSSGIVDSHGLMAAMEADLQRAGGVLSVNSRVERAEVSAGGIWRLQVEDVLGRETSTIKAGSVVNCAGMHAHTVAALVSGMPTHLVPRVWFAKGNYFALSGHCPFSRLIYPTPEEGGLGAHLTIDLGSPPQAKFGPDVEWLSTQRPEEVSFDVDERRLGAMLASIRSYWPGVPVDALHTSYSGVRVKLAGPGMPAADFQVQTPAEHGMPGLVNVFGIESPGLTSSLALGAFVRDKLLAAAPRGG